MTAKVDFESMLARLPKEPTRPEPVNLWRCPSCGEARPGTTCAPCDAAEAVKKTVATLPPRYADARLDLADIGKRVRTAGAIDAARRAIGRMPVVLCGGAGSGKSTLGAALLVAWAEQTGKRGMFADCKTLARARSEHKMGLGEAPLVERAMRAPVLYLDELGGDDGKGTGESAVVDVIHERYDQMRPTIFGTWMSLQAVESRYGAGVARRVYEGATVVRLG